MKAGKWPAITLVLTLIGSVVTGCSGGAGSDSPLSAGQELRVNYRAEPPVLDSSKATTSGAFTMIGAFNEGLYRLDENGKVRPGLAKDLPRISADRKTYTIILRDGLTYSDGTPVKASDFEFAFKRTLDPATKSPYAAMLAWIKGGTAVMKARTPEEVEEKKKEAGVKALDDKTLEIALEKPIPYFTEQLAFVPFFPQQPDFVKKQGDRYGADADKVLGAGPFKLEKWDHEQQLVFVKNDRYWDKDNVKLERITLRIVKDDATGLNLFESGAADVSIINRGNVKAWRNRPEFVSKKELTTSFIMYNQKNASAFRNKKIRQALTMAIDNQAYVETVLGDGSVAATGFVPVGTSDGDGHEFRQIAGNLQPEYDPAKAKELLAEGLRELNMDSLPPFRLTADDSENGKKSLEFILAQWKQNLGVEAIAEPLPYSLRVSRQENRDYDALVSLWNADYNDPMTFLGLWVTGGEFNEVDWSNPEYDKLIEAAQNEADGAKRARLLVEAERILMEEVPVGPNFFRTQAYLVNPRVKGLIMPMIGPDFEFKWTYIR